MYKKLCPNCHKPSFSSNESGKWICPTCNRDLSKAKLQAAERHHHTKPQLFLIHDRYAQQNKPSQQQVSPYIFKSSD